MIILLLLGLALGLDSLRVSLGLGALKPPLRRQCALAAAFGLCDGLAPLLGLWLGRDASDSLRGMAELVGPLLLAAYGLYLLATSWLGAEDQEELRWQLFGLPVMLSLDNLIAGAGLGLLRYPPLFSVAVLGMMSGLLAFAGLRLGGVIAGRLPFHAARVCGMILLLAAALAVLDSD